MAAILVEVHVNGAATRDLAMLRTLPDGCDQMEAGALRTAGLYEGTESDVCLHLVSGLDYQLDREAARVELFSEALVPDASGRNTRRRTYAPALAGLMGQYGFSAQRVEDASGVYENAFADLSLTLHTKWGRLQNDQVAAWDGERVRARRLATAYEQDFPDNMARLTLGDSFTRAPRWGRLAAFAGVQFGTDFSMDTDQTYRPYRTFQTLLREQSEIDVRVNGAVRQRESVAAGFSEFQIAPETGFNDVEIAIREASGLTRIEDMSFFAATDGLARGVTDYSVSLGVPRRFNGLSSEYGETLVASGLVRRGLSDSVTAEAHGEFSEAVSVIGGGAQFAVDEIGVLTIAAGASAAETGARGHLVSAGLERSTRRANLQLQARVADPDYADAATAAGAMFPDVTLRASASVFTSLGSFRTSYSEQSDRDLPDRRFVSAGWEKSLRGNQMTLSASGFHDLERGETGCTLRLRFSFGSYSAGVSGDRFAGASSAAVDLSRLRQPGERIQWSVQAASGEGADAAQANLQADLGAADVYLHAGQFGATNDLSAGVRGAFTLLPGRMMLARQSTPATARVRVPGLAGVPVYQDNRRVAVTDADGAAMIPGVRPFEVNRFSLRPEDVPLDYAVAGFDLDFVPRRGIADVAFEVRRTSALAFTAALPDGTPLAAGSRVMLSGSGQGCAAGLDGRVYCAAADDGDSVIVITPQGRFAQPVSRLRQSGQMTLEPTAALKMAGVS